MSRIAILAGVVGVVFASVAGASISQVSGDVQKIAAPPSVKFGALESNTTIFAFDEQQCVKLTKPLKVDITQSGKVNQPGDLTPGVIPAGTFVSSHFVHVDPKGNDKLIRVEGSVRTDRRILGVIVTGASLNASDFLGAPGTQYPTGNFGRHMEFGQMRDIVTLRDPKRQVDIVSKVRLHNDQLRIVTRCHPDDDGGGGGNRNEGCSHGFWKHAQHFDSWVGYAPTDKFETVFGVDAFPDDPTLLDVLNLGGGGTNALGRQAVAALLNASSPDIDFRLTPTEVILLTKNAVVNGSAGTIEATKNRFEELNEKRCPLS